MKYYQNEINKSSKEYNFNQIEINNFFKKFNIIYRKNHEYQCIIPKEELEKNINIIKKQYPDYEVIIVQEPDIKDNKSISQRKDCLEETDSMDKDLWIMINSNILVTSKSSFSLIPAFLHKGEKIYFQEWGIIGSVGLGSKYDKTKDLIDYEFI